LERSASVRFEGVLAESERAAAIVAWDSVGATVSSWATSRAGRTYALLHLASDADLERVRRTPAARVDEPPLVVLEVAPRDPDRIPALLDALGGPGGPAGVLWAAAYGDGLALELDERVTPLRLVVDVIDAELAPSPGRRITPLLRLSDATATAFAAATLAAPEIDPERLIETHLDAFLAGAT
jgi:hypothetical protein